MAKKRAKTQSSGNGNGNSGFKLILIPPLNQGEFDLWLIGDRPLLLNNKLPVSQAIDDVYGEGGKGKHIPKPTRTKDEQYADSFYVMPDSKYAPPDPRGRYGVPASGIKKCACTAIRQTGESDNTTIGVVQKAFWVMEDAGGLCWIQSKTMVRDIRPVNVGSGTKTVPQMRHRPLFREWKIKVRLRFNANILNQASLVNIFMHAGAYVGLCELRAEKKQGQCGGFIVKGTG